MTNKSKFSITAFLRNMVFIIPNLLNLIHHFVSISAYETKLAIKSLVIIFGLSFLVAALSTTTWLGLLTMLYIFLTTSVHWSPIVSISVVVSVNVLMLVILAIIILRLKRNLEFSETRKQLQVMKSLYRE